MKKGTNHLEKVCKVRKGGNMPTCTCLGGLGFSLPFPNHCGSFYRLHPIWSWSTIAIPHLVGKPKTILDRG